jgi:multidrug efflux pump subunit AcrA (membrane-fusion protein)
LGLPDVEELSHSLSFLLCAALSFAANAAFAQIRPQRMGMVVGVVESGVVRAIDVTDGAHVDAGQTLVELDCEPLRKEVDVRAADLAAAQAVYERVVSGPRPEEIVIGEAGGRRRPRRAPKKRAPMLDRARGLVVGVSITLALAPWSMSAIPRR